MLGRRRKKAIILILFLVLFLGQVVWSVDVWRLIVSWLVSSICVSHHHSPPIIDGVYAHMDLYGSEWEVILSLENNYPF